MGRICLSKSTGFSWARTGGAPRTTSPRLMRQTRILLTLPLIAAPRWIVSRRFRIKWPRSSYLLRARKSRQEEAMSILKAAMILVLPLVVGCIAYYDEPPRHYAPAPAETTVTVSPEAEEVHYVVYREYFGCSEAEIAYFPHYRR